MEAINKLKRFIFRKTTSINGKSLKNRINLEYWSGRLNIGDALSPVVYRYMLQRFNLDENKKVKGVKHLSAIGSVLSHGMYNSTVWGSGLYTIDSFKKIFALKKIRKFDIRAVRGPVTQAVMLTAGYKCPSVFGDPAILMPLIYDSDCKKEYDVAVVTHLNSNLPLSNKNVHYIDVKTDDYKFFINEIKKSKLIISSSLHGIILAEVYGVPAIFVKDGVEDQIYKYLDWYYSTNRYNVVIADDFSSALALTPMPLPSKELLFDMQEKLINAFPVDLWE